MDFGLEFGLDFGLRAIVAHREKTLQRTPYVHDVDAASLDRSLTMRAPPIDPFARN